MTKKSEGSQQPCRPHLVLVNGITLLLVLQCGAELCLALVNPGDQMMAASTQDVKAPDLTESYHYKHMDDEPPPHT